MSNTEFDQTLVARGESHLTDSRNVKDLARGSSVGRYLLLDRLGTGGMGTVFAAYDPELDRKVAVKLVTSDADSAGRARLLREAQALARLAHPNVVAVHDVGTLGAQVWIAMEFVGGLTLGVWAKEHRRSWPDVLRVLLDAARGIAAAHAVGLVHRDLKPDNVMIGSDGRIRVMDFGLAHGRNLATAEPALAATASGNTAARPDLAALELRLTRAGAVLGTPAYMAPEQWQGKEADAAVDQFGWSVMAWELLYGESPFAADTVIALAAMVLAGQRRPPPRGRKVPGWLRRAVERGLSVDPARRWPSMVALIEALERDPKKTRLRVAGLVVLLGLASGVSYAAAGARTGAQDRCGGGAQELAGVWDGARRQAITEAFHATRAPFAADVLQRVESRLDGYTSTWVNQYRAACEASSASSQFSHLQDQQMACLARRKVHVSAVVDVLATADRSVVENAVQAVAALPSVHSCADAEALLSVAPPADAQTALRVDQMRGQLAQAEALESIGRYEQGLVMATKVRGESDSLGYGPLVAESALVEGSLMLAVGRSSEADAALVQASKVAIVQDMHAEAAEAMAKRIFVLSTGLRKHEGALAIQPMAEALVQRANDDLLTALLQNNLGVAYAISGDLAMSTNHFEKTIAQLSAGDGPLNPLLAATYNNLGNLYVEQSRPEQARASFTAAVELFTKLVGDRHPSVAWPLRGLGQVALNTGKYAEAERYFVEALTLMEAAFGPVQHLIPPLVGLGRVYTRTGRLVDAIKSYRHAIVMGEQAQSNDPGFAEALEELGELTAARGEYADAQKLFERAVKANEAAHGKDSSKQAKAALQAGEMAGKLGDHAGAIDWYEHVLALPADANDEVQAAAAVGRARELEVSLEVTAHQ